MTSSLETDVENTFAGKLFKMNEMNRSCSSSLREASPLASLSNLNKSNLYQVDSLFDGLSFTEQVVCVNSLLDFRMKGEIWSSFDKKETSC